MSCDDYCMTSQDQLNLVQQAISDLLTSGASSYSINGRNVTKLDLKTLMELEQNLLIRVQRESGSGGFSLARFSRTS